jgi:hypothetical protein
MALGLNLNGSSEGGDIIPYCKYDSRAGRVSRSDRKQGSDGAYVNEIVDITSNFKAVFDMENIEVGYLMFAAGAAPQMMVVPLGSPMPTKPPTDGWKQGVRFLLKLHSSCGGDIREMSSNAASFLRGFDELHTAYEAGKKANPGKLPIVSLMSTQPVTTGQGSKKSTNYQPHFAITGWAPRPNDLVFVSKAIGHQTELPAVEYTSAPSTGSTPVGPPAATKQTAMADNDFG